MNPQLWHDVLLLPLLWPLLLALLIAVAGSGSRIQRWLPTAAVPALIVAVTLPPTSLDLPTVLLGAGLRLDPTSRPLLILTASLWLVSTVLLQRRHQPLSHHDHHRRVAVLALLAMGGTFGLALANDGIVLFAAGTLAGYALYGLLQQGTDRCARAAGRRLVILLVLSDLLVFELLLILAHAVGSTALAALQDAIRASASANVLFGLLLVGFGVKAGVLGAHLWLVPAFRSASDAVQLILITYVAAAGLFGWLALLPLGSMHWPNQGLVLIGLALATLSYAVLRAMLRTDPGDAASSLIMALSALWLCAIGLAIHDPQSAPRLTADLPLFLLHITLAFAALLLLRSRAEQRQCKGWRMTLTALMALLVALAALPFLRLGLDVEIKLGWALWWPSLGVALLAGRSVMQPRAAQDQERSLTRRSGHSRQQTLAGIGLAAGAAAVAGAAALGIAPNAVGLAWRLVPASHWSHTVLDPLTLVALISLATAFIGGWASGGRRARRPTRPQARSWSRTEGTAATGLRLLGHRLDHLARATLPAWRDAAWHGVHRLVAQRSWRTRLAFIEARLTQWDAILTILVLLGLGIAWLALSH
ncbi:hypothetical protein CKO25_17020 [Thiocapsa imhoffii]|uniref:NADH:quinone oxidoreductase/Mrp antiporter transmembrane domain-containing protein n=1 Tax=Thiocapsa imhoffii TaxID=382777 RepID=A0A9X0WKP4_9GAMM|nr:proton-conducting transporter membrane subunit [Thiocapsa imhoffii]MBK1646318.1 hypothetical protein [Thiocapsa imhoffii]